MNHLVPAKTRSCSCSASQRVHLKRCVFVFALWLNCEHVGVCSSIDMCVCRRGCFWTRVNVATSGHDGFGIKATQHPAGKSNNCTRHHPTRPLSLLYPVLSHYSPFHPSLSWPFCLSVHLAHPPPFSCHLSSLHPFTKHKGIATCISNSLFYPSTSSINPPSPGVTATQQIVRSILCASPPWLLPPTLHPKWNSRRSASPCFALINFDTHAMNNETDIDDGAKRRGSLSHGL